MTKPTSEQVTFLAAGSGATQRTALDKFRDVVSVKDFGAVGDGVADDTAAIQAALNSGAACVHVPDGVYGIGSQLTVPAGVTVLGSGNQSEIKMLSSLDTMIGVGGDNVHFARLALRGTDTEISASANERLIVASGRTNVTVSDCTLLETVIAVQFDDCDECAMRSCYVEGIRHRIDLSQGYGILCNSDCNGIVIDGNRFEDIGRHAIYVSSGSSNATISSNTVRTCESVAISVFATSAQNPCSNISIVANSIHSVAGVVSPRGITAAVNVDGISICGNVVNDTQSHGIYVEGGSAELQADNPRNIVISGNSVMDCGASGIGSINTSNIVVSGNSCHACSTGIAITSDSSGTGGLFSNAAITGNQCTSSVVYGINISGSASCSGVKLSANRFTGSGTADYWLPTLSGTSLLPSIINFGDAAEQYTFTAGSVAAGVTDQVMNAPISGFGSYRTQGKRYAVALSASVSSAITAGTATVTLFKGASAQPVYNVVLNSSNQSAVNIQGVRQTYAATDDIVVKVTTDGSFTVASTSNIQAVVRMIHLAD